MKQSRIGWSGLALVAVALSGCVASGVLPERQQALPAAWANGAALEAGQAPAPARWWTAFEDHELDALVEKTLAQNLTLAQAAQQLKAARALLRPVLSQRLPQVNLEASAQRKRRVSGKAAGEAAGAEPGGLPEALADEQPWSQAERTVGFYQAGFDASWEIDLFGRIDAAADAARAGIGAAEADVRNARVSVVAEVVRSYVELRGAQRRHLLLAQVLRDQERLGALVEQRRRAGIASDFDVDRARTVQAETAAQLPLLEHQARQAAQRIAVLSGSAQADPALQAEAAQPQARSFGLQALPADLLRGRPDVQRAEQQVLQAAAELKVARAELAPRLSLAGDILVSGNLAGKPLPGRSTYASAGLNLSLPLLDWGARRAVAGAREAELAAAILGYRQTVLEGVEETENALSALAAERRRAGDVQIQVDAARRADRHASQLHERGLSSLLERLDAAQARRQAEIAAAAAVEQQALALVALHKALGGGALAP